MMNPILRRVLRRSGLAAGAMSFGLATLTGCGDTTAPLVTAWRATLTPVLPYAISGRAAALTQAGRTRVTISIEGAEIESSYAWRVERGTCAAPGALVGGVASYPPLEPGAGGSAEAEASLAELFQFGDDLIVRVLVDGEGPAVITAACAPFEETDP
ncbi:hypothetical protein [Gaopeijia maritima]|uniref:Uncharacterized protein n=1 Tax=Gaopeijia maritima TaxID=3119007 RepID=A0ABU9E9A9_9BACT